MKNTIIMKYQSRVCPFNRFHQCKGGQCAVSIEMEGKAVCSLEFIGHEIFTLTELMMQDESTDATEEKTHG
jgi:hypothetical protein